MGGGFGLDIAEPGCCFDCEDAFGEVEPGGVHEDFVAVAVRFSGESGDAFGLGREADAGGVPGGILFEIGADIGNYLGDGVLVDEVAEIEAAVAD